MSSISKAEAIMKKASVATIAKIDENEYSRPSTISCIKTDGVKTVWFTTGLNSSKAKLYKSNKSRYLLS